MRWHNYEFLDTDQNFLVNQLLNNINRLVSRGLITIKEADYTFQEKMMETFSKKQAFDICTNREEFTKAA